MLEEMTAIEKLSLFLYLPFSPSLWCGPIWTFHIVCKFQAELDHDSLFMVFQVSRFELELGGKIREQRKDN